MSIIRPRSEPLDPAETLLSAGVITTVALWLYAWTIYVLSLPTVFLAFTPALIFAGIFFARAPLRKALRDVEARHLLLSQVLISLWCVVWLSFIVSYSGGGWSGDWFEHWERTRFFLERGSLETRFLGIYQLPARPPLANVITGALLTSTEVSFASYQLCSTLLSSLAFFPAALLARRFGGARAMAVFCVLLAVNPLFVQNATFAWTKLPAAAGVLAALYFFLRCQDARAPQWGPGLFAASLAVALLTHYSAGPAAVVLAGAWCVRGWNHRCDPAWWRSTLGGVWVGALILSTWFLWSMSHYSLNGTFLTNTSVTSSASNFSDQLMRILLNLRDTFVPHVLRPIDDTLIAQPTRWGYVRDGFFQFYQLNFPFACGTIATVVLAREILRAAKIKWVLAITAVVVISIAVHGERDTWGLTHICLQPLVILSLAFLASRWKSLTRSWKLALATGLAFDFTAGIGLHFAAQSYALARWIYPHGALNEIFNSYNQIALGNLLTKIQHQLAFVADRSTVSPALALALLVAILSFMLVRARADTS